MRRRTFLQGLAAVAGVAASGRAAAGGEPPPRLVLIVLRGGLDGLAAFPAYGDPSFAEARGDVALPPPGADAGAIALDGTFGMHPTLAPLVPLWEAGQLLPIHAVASPYGDRSHFDGQEVLESGMRTPFTSSTGWLHRALVDTGRSSLAIGATVPRVLHGPGAASADPLRLDGPDPALLEHVRELYAQDPVFGPALTHGLALRSLLARARGPASTAGARAGAAAVVGRALADEQGPHVVVVSIGGCDTHAGQAKAIERPLDELARTIVGLREGLGVAWARTVVLAVTEFGRTVASNGSGGTDHGVGGAAMLAGGAVRGGRVLADWPGLRRGDLLDARDLRPTLDLRSVFKGVLCDHLGLDAKRVEREVFPDSASAPPLAGLVGPAA